MHVWYHSEYTDRAGVKPSHFIIILFMFLGPMVYGTSYHPVSRKEEFLEKKFAGKGLSNKY